MPDLFVVGFLAALATAAVLRVLPLSPIPVIALLVIAGFVIYVSIEALLHAIVEGWI